MVERSFHPSKYNVQNGTLFFLAVVWPAEEDAESGHRQLTRDEYTLNVTVRNGGATHIGFNNSALWLHRVVRVHSWGKLVEINCSSQPDILSSDTE